MMRRVDGVVGAYDDFLDAAWRVLRARGASGGRRSPECDAALQILNDKWDLFKASCDLAEGFVLTAQRDLLPMFAVPDDVMERTSTLAAVAPPNAAASTADDSAAVTDDR
ncbi:Mediator of RNA polymerase II transcription subunit 32 [Apostasia shenzhenica]|uniref:Mediator of RNA polymerase II transcription subunit 32 n=1 Tax=Apostasia shenzhenica TaxID=1088818 RepID=A0A2I0AT61_9ASPA|nr:Mediator of RNA polymerase II transcription subunit 32 [Apostasia shenzhenica]